MIASVSVPVEMAEVMAEVDFRSAWTKNDQNMMADVRAFWRALGGVVTRDEIAERLPQLCAVAYDGDRVAAVSTAGLYDFPRLRSRFAYYRTTVGPAYRRQRLAARLCTFSTGLLKEWGHAHPEEKLKGVFIVLQAKEFRERQRQPFVQLLGLNYTLVGFTPGGYQMRVVWFDDALLE